MVGKAKYFFHAGARSVPPKVSRVLSPLPSSSLHPPVESLMRARQPPHKLHKLQCHCHSHLVTVQLAAVPECWIKAFQDICKGSVNYSEVCFSAADKPPDRKLNGGCLEHFLCAVYPPTPSQCLPCPQCSLADCWLETGKVPWLTTFLCSTSWPQGLWL